MSERPTSEHRRRGAGNAKETLSVRAEVTKHQSRSAALVEYIGQMLANPVLVIVLFGAHGLWLVLNLPIVPGLRPWDPYPFPLLATLTSAEAPLMALLILMYQRRSSRISELREEIDLQVSLHLEQQMTVMLRLLGEVQDKLGIASGEDRALLEELRRELDPKTLLTGLRRHLRESEDDEQATAP